MLFIVTATTKESFMKLSSDRAKNWLFPVTVTFILCLVIYYFFTAIQPSRKNTKNLLGTVKKGDLIQRITIAGTVVPYRKTIITAPYKGYVKKIYVKIGDIIKQNDPVVSIVQSLQSPEEVYPIRAPFSGMVVQVEKSDGEFVKEGDPKDFIARIDDTSKLFIQATAPEIDRVKLKIGQEAEIKASAILDRSYSGIVRELSLAAKEPEQWNNKSQIEFSLRIEVTNADITLKPGMSTIIDITANKKENALLLRHEFIDKKDNKYLVTLANGKKQEIKVGIQNDEAFEITEGLKEGDQVKQIDFLSSDQGDSGE